MRYGVKPRWQQRIALERIEILLKLAAKEFKKHPARANRYVKLAREIGMRYNVRLPKELKRKICKKCYRYLVVGVNCKVRTKAKQIIVKCLNCGNVMRYPYRKGKVAGRVETRRRFLL